MKILAVRGLGVCVALMVCLAAVARAQPAPPALTSPVNDFANVIDPESEAALDALIRSLQQASGDVVVVAAVDTFQPYGDIREYAVRMFENGGRGIGARGKDNGLLVLLAVNDRRVQVEVGYDLEQFITDGYAGQVSRQEMESKGLAVTGDLTTWVGPWGVSYTANLTPDSTGTLAWTEEQFIYALRNGVTKGLKGSRPMLPPMPWPEYKHMTDGELKAIFAYLRTIKPVNNLVPPPKPPVSARKS